VHGNSNITILHPTAHCPKNVVISDVSGDICFPKLFAVFPNVNPPACKLPSELSVMT